MLPRCLTSDLPSWAFKTCDRRHIKCLQDVWVGKCGATTVQHWLVDQLLSAATVPSDPIVRCQAAHVRDVVGQQRPDMRSAIEDIICYF
jgi:hypothetical protein